ncbi:MAG TPA: XdhC family protein [Tepidisphaeraceae bacterium]|nr:XdhC family protein [Tepidisphaeraceae bacterium]
MRTELPKLIAMARRLLDNGEPGVLATLVSAKGSSYRSLGSMMVGGPPGVIAGGVSGGCLEEYVVRRGREMTRDRGAVLLSFDTGGADDVDEVKPVLGCGGSIDVLVERLTDDQLELLRRLAWAYDNDVGTIMTCTIESRGDADAVVVGRQWGRPDESDPSAALARLALCDRRGYCGATHGGRRTFVQFVPPLTRLVIFGAGDDARPVCDLAGSLGWHVTVADRRARRARAEHFPSADVVVAAPWEEAVGRIRFTGNTAVVLMTHSLPDDAILLPLLAGRPLAYAGVLGPAHRRDALLGLVTEGGLVDENFGARLRGPIGLDLGDRSAAGIAVSVVAEILAHLHERQARPMSDAPAPPRTAVPVTAHG